MEPRKRGRPKGSKTAKGIAPVVNIEHADPTTLVERQFVLAEWMQSAFRAEIQRRMGDKNVVVDTDDVRRFSELTSALDRAIRSLAGMEKLAEELQKRMTPEQLLDAMLKKIESQEPSFIRYAIKRLRAYHDRVVPKADPNRTPLGTLAELMEE